MLSSEIEKRRSSLEPFGVVFTKAFGRSRGVNPVWYIDQTPGHDWLTEHLDKMLDEVVDEASVGGKMPLLLHLTPFFETMGTGRARHTGKQYRKEFAWEREWRHVNDFRFEWGDLVAVFAPSARHQEIIHRVSERSSRFGSAADVDSSLRFLDPEWGLERMIAQLAGVPEKDAGPLPPFPEA